MKRTRFMPLLMGLLLAAGCKNGVSKFTKPFEVVTVSLSDSLDDDWESQEDSLFIEESMDEAPLPATVDELFDDFLFAFDHNIHLQQQRIRFPLSVIEADGETHLLQQADWTHHTLIQDHDFCTVLWNNRSQMALMQDSSVCRASVEQIYLHSRQIEAYLFERDSTSGQWMLTEQRHQPFEHSALQEFLNFYREWSTDSIYQRRHVQDPLQMVLTDENEENGTIEGTIDVDQWFEFAPDLPSDVISNIDYGQTFHNPHRIILQVRGFSNSLQILLTFHRDAAGNWRLIKYEN